MTPNPLLLRYTTTALMREQTIVGRNCILLRFPKITLQIVKLNLPSNAEHLVASLESEFRRGLVRP